MVIASQTEKLSLRQSEESDAFSLSTGASFLQHIYEVICVPQGT